MCVCVCICCTRVCLCEMNVAYYVFDCSTELFKLCRIWMTSCRVSFTNTGKRNASWQFCFLSVFLSLSSLWHRNSILYTACTVLIRKTCWKHIIVLESLKRCFYNSHTLYNKYVNIWNRSMKPEAKSVRIIGSQSADLKRTQKEKDAAITTHSEIFNISSDSADVKLKLPSLMEIIS